MDGIAEIWKEDEGSEGLTGDRAKRENQIRCSDLLLRMVNTKHLIESSGDDFN